MLSRQAQLDLDRLNKPDWDRSPNRYPEPGAGLENRIIIRNDRIELLGR